MKETLYTIPLTDALLANDECPFCYIERNVEQDLLDLVLGSGSSYMESDMRSQTDQAGFCRNHFKKMFEYGNTLGNAWILKTHYVQINRELEKQVKMFSPGKVSLMNKMKKNADTTNSMANWIKEREQSCYICNSFATTYQRYLDTFFYMYKKDQEMTEMLKKSKGLCLHHFGDICAEADRQLNDKQKEVFYPLLFELMQENMKRVGEDIAWLVEKFDYRNKDADLQNSNDSSTRGIQQPGDKRHADPVYQ